MIRRRSVAAALGACILAAATAQAAPGDLDPTFGAGGISVLGLQPGGFDQPFSADLQPDGRILVGGRSAGRDAGSPFLGMVARVTPQGPLDRSFGGGDGFTLLEDPRSFGEGVARQGDGRILVASGVTSPTGKLPQIARLTDPAGLFDGTFGGGNGFVRPEIPRIGGELFDLVVQADGRIVAAGATAGPDDDERNMLVVRVDPLGNPDTGFGGGTGIARADFPDDGSAGGARSVDVANAVALDPDGGIVLAGTGGRGAGVARFRADGSPDAAFGARADGTVNLPLNGADDVAVQADGGILVPGESGRPTRATVVRLRRDGAPDPTFGTAGAASVAPADAERFSAVLALPDGRILVAGTIGGSQDGDIVVMRLQADGRPDVSFGAAGRSVVDAGGSESPVALLRQPDGRILVVGGSTRPGTVGNDSDIVVARLQADPPAPAPPGPTAVVAPPIPAAAPISAPAPAGATPATSGRGTSAVATSLCGGRPATIVGTAGNDRLTGTPGPDVIAALAGDDTVSGLGGDDVVCGGAGDDTLGGGAGRDRLLGQAGRDVLRGGAGRDSLLGGAGPDRLVGGAGVDVLNGGPGKDAQTQ